ncbi:MAG: murein biosynthesis integral membrane protein MurJ, partial [Steroidobacteraceae bacterium]
MPQADIPAAGPSAAAAPPRHEKLNTRAASVVALAVLCSRLLGLVRDQVFGSIFGGGEVMDAFQMAFRIPN